MYLKLLNSNNKEKFIYKCVLFLFIIIYLSIPMIFPNKRYILSILSTSSTYSCIALGVWLTFLIGRINIGQAAFVSIGGYTAAILLTRYGLSFWISFPLAGIITALFSLVLGLVILGLKGIYFSMVTLIITAFTSLLFLNTYSLTNGPKGILNIPRPEAIYIGNLNIIPEFTQDNNAFYYLTFLTLLLCISIVYRIDNSRIGNVLKSIRQNEPLSQSLGINVVKYRILAYTICGFFAGLGGALFIVQIQNIFPQTFKVQDSINYLLYCFLGGLDYVFGPIVGAFLLTISFELLRAIQRWQEIIYAVIMISLMLWLPNGVLSLRLPRLNRLIKKIRR